MDNLRDILVIFFTEEHGLVAKDFEEESDVAKFIGTETYFIKQVLKGKKIKGEMWKPNIFYKNIGEGKQHRFIVVYTKDWIDYSEKQRVNRINKLKDGR